MNHLYHVTTYLLTLAAFVFTSCSDEIAGVQSGTGEKITLSGSIEQIYMTRVDDNGFANGDVMGVYVVDYNGTTAGTLLNSGNRADNLKHTFDYATGKWNSAYDVYFKDDHTPIDIYGYYPFSTPNDVNAYDFQVKKDQSKSAENGALGGYEASDFLWGKAENIAPTNKVIRLPMYHHMSSARVTLTEGTGFNAGEWNSLDKYVLIMNTVRNAKIGLSNGSVTPSGSAVQDGIIPYRSGNEFRAIVVPQTIASNTILFQITVGGVNYSFNKEVAFTYKPNKMHNFTIQVNKKSNSGEYSFTLVDESITAWEADNISHDGTAKEYVMIHVPTAGTLAACIKAANKDYKRLQNLKVTGIISPKDFTFMRDSMSILKALNLKEVILADEYKGKENDEIPASALSGKSTLFNLILPDKLNVIKPFAFYGTSILGSLTIPEGTTLIENSAFAECKNLTGTLTLPSTLQEIGSCVFSKCGFMCELKLPANLKIIGRSAFEYCSSLNGSLKLPDNLQEIGGEAFSFCSNLTGNLEIPQGISKIPIAAFQCCGFNGTLKLNDGITEISGFAFNRCQFRGQLVLPKNLSMISEWAFPGNNFSGELKLPSELLSIQDGAFNENAYLTGTLTIPDKVMSIGEHAFQNCRQLEGLVLPAGIETIKDNAFYMCNKLKSLICNNITPPFICSNTFDGVPKNNFALEVPEKGVSEYKATKYWNDFQRIAAHHELGCQPETVNCLNASHTHTMVLNAGSSWTVESKPDWCSLSASSGSQKTELTLTVDELAKGSSNRTGKIVFKLNDYDYTDTCIVNQYNYSDYSEDEPVTLQTHTQGKGINLLFIGDGFSAKDISEGTYLKDMKMEIENFFSIEPYKTYRNYFNVYTLIAMSPESGIDIGKTSKFGATFTSGSLKGNDSDIFAYALKVPAITTSNLNKSLIVVVPNTQEYGGVTSLYADGSAISYCPMSIYDYPLNTRGVLQHEACGHGFGKLGDEQVYYNEFINEVSAKRIQYCKSFGWYDNLSLTGKSNEVTWSHLIYNSHYSDIVDVFEGGYNYAHGIYRSEQNSCMNNDVPYFNTISREAIVKRIMEYAGETFTFEKFVANDNRENSTSAMRTRAIQDQYKGSNVGSFQHSPIIHRGRPVISKRKFNR
jgi:hypothetical protein